METKRNWGGKRGGLFLRSNVRRVKSSLRAYKVSRCYRGVSNWEEEGEEKRRKEERRLGGRKKDRGNKLWKRERGYIYIYIYRWGSLVHRPGFESTIFDTDFRRRNPYLERCLGLILGGEASSLCSSPLPCLASPLRRCSIRYR